MRDSSLGKLTRLVSVRDSQSVLEWCSVMSTEKTLNDKCI